MSKNYDKIAKVDIDIVSPIVDDTSFDNLLIVGPIPKKTEENKDIVQPDVGAYSSLMEVADMGWNSGDPVYDAAMVAFSQSPKPGTVYIAPMKVTKEEVEDEEGNVAEEFVQESAVETIERALATSGWYVVCPAGVDEDEYEEIAEYIETTEKMCVYTETQMFTWDTIQDEKGESQKVQKLSPTVSNIYYRTKGVYGCINTKGVAGSLPDKNKYLNVAWVTKWLNYETGSETSAFKVLAAVTPSALSTTEMKQLEAANLNYFITVGNKNITMNGKVLAGEWADIIRFRDWLKNEMQVRVVNLFVTNPKIPFTDSGIALVQNTMNETLKRGQYKGGIAEDEFDADGNKIPGFVTSVPLSASLTASEKQSRILKDCKFKARPAGAIHFTEIGGSLTFTL